MSRRHSLAVLILIAVVFVLSTTLRSTSTAVSLNDTPFAPVAVDDYYTVHNQMLLTPMANDYNPDPYGGLSFNAIETQPQHGTLTQYNAESYTYHSTYGYTGADSFTYSIKDAYNNIATATVHITDVNQAPIAVPDFYIKVGSLLITPAQNDFDPDVGDSLNFQSVVTQPQHGTLGFYTTGTYTYTPTSGYTGFDSFTYSIVDQLGGTNVGTVYLLVLSQTPSAAKAPYGCSCAADPGGSAQFDPTDGGLQQQPTGPAGTSGPAAKRSSKPHHRPRELHTRT